MKLEQMEKEFKEQPPIVVQEPRVTFNAGLPDYVFMVRDPITGLARFMTVTEDGRTVPLEDID